LSSGFFYFETVAQEVKSSTVPGNKNEDFLLQKLDRRGRIILGLFSKQEEITSNEVASVLGLSTRQARDLLLQWTDLGWLEMSKKARKSRRYRLSAEYRRFIGEAGRSLICFSSLVIICTHLAAQDRLISPIDFPGINDVGIGDRRIVIRPQCAKQIPVRIEV
jgi:hypothetical protein